MNKLVRVGTRNSPLAMIQAKKVTESIENLGFKAQTIPIVSSGDKDLTQPIYSLGIVGVFTKDLDIALLNGEIDIAVHSLKDVPTALPQGVVISAVLERDYAKDVLIRKKEAQGKSFSELNIASSSLRRRALWINKYPNTTFSNIRGNVQTRLQKLENGEADATILSLAGIKRLGLDVDYQEIPFMIPSACQGIVACTSLWNSEYNEMLKKINDEETFVMAQLERSFLQELGGGCSQPIAALAQKVKEKIVFKGIVASIDGLEIISIEEETIFLDVDSKYLGKLYAQKILQIGGKEVLKRNKEKLK